MSEPQKLPTNNCSGCWKYFPVERLAVRVGGKNRKLRYCPACLSRREKALREIRR